MCYVFLKMTLAPGKRSKQNSNYFHDPNYFCWYNYTIRNHRPNVWITKKYPNNCISYLLWRNSWRRNFRNERYVLAQTLRGESSTELGAGGRCPSSFHVQGAHEGQRQRSQHVFLLMEHKVLSHGLVPPIFRVILPPWLIYLSKSLRHFQTFVPSGTLDPGKLIYHINYYGNFRRLHFKTLVVKWRCSGEEICGINMITSLKK